VYERERERQRERERERERERMQIHPSAFLFYIGPEWIGSIMLVRLVTMTNTEINNLKKERFILAYGFSP
jgi:small neutral amino acid transporter SnatA (MarC family)